MNLKQIALVTAGLVAFGAAAQNPPNSMNAAPPTNGMTASEPPTPPGRTELSEALGIFSARGTTNTLLRSGIDFKTDVDPVLFITTMSNTLVGASNAMTLDEANVIMQREQAYQKEKLQSESKRIMAEGPENKTKGEKFLASNLSAAGVHALEDHLQYRVEKEGAGQQPTSNDLVQVNIRATTIDGTELVKVEHQKLKVSGSGLPPGLSEALTMMKVGSKWTVFLPYQLAYGEGTAFPGPNQLPRVGPESALIFELELEAVQPAPPSPPQPMAPPTPPTAPRASGAPPVQLTGSEIIRVPSLDEMKKGSNIQTMTPDQIKAEIERHSQTNSAGPK